MNQIEVFKVDSCGNDGDDGQKKKKEQMLILKYVKLNFLPFQLKHYGHIEVYN